MKAVKIIVAILLILLLPLASSIHLSPLSTMNLDGNLEDMGLGNFKVSVVGLPIVTFLFILSACVITIVWRKRFYGALTAGILTLIPYMWSVSLRKFMIEEQYVLDILCDKDVFPDGVKGIADMFLMVQVFLLLPMVVLLIIGIVETIVHFVKKKKGILSVTDSACVEHAVESVKEFDIDSNIGDLKKYKELLDAGIITQEEFDVKKKQLLNL